VRGSRSVSLYITVSVSIIFNLFIFVRLCHQSRRTKLCASMPSVSTHKDKLIKGRVL
jgi:hypothetical protein